MTGASAEERKSERIGRLAGDSLLYSLGPVAQKAVGLVLLPLLARVLDRDQFGRVEILSTIATSVTAIAVIGLDIIVTRRYADLDPPERRRLFGSWLAIAAGIGTSLVLIAVGVANPVARAMFGDSRLAAGIVLAALFALIDLGQIIGLTALRNEGRAGTYAVVASGAAVLNGLAVGGLTLRYRDELSVMIGITVSVGAGAVAALYAARRIVFGRPTRTETGLLLRSAAPLVPGLVMMWGGELVNRTILLAVAGASEVGELSVAIRFGTVGLLLVSGIQLAWYPRAYATAHTEAGRRQLAKDGTAIIVTISILSASIAAASPEALLLVAGNKYADALPAIGVALLMPITMSIFLVLTLPSTITNQMKAYGFALGAGAASTMALTGLLAPPLGAVGAAAAQAGGPLVGGIVALMRSRKLGQKLEHDWGRIALIVGASIAVIGLATMTEVGERVAFRISIAVVIAAVVAILEGPALIGAWRRIRSSAG